MAMNNFGDITESDETAWKSEAFPSWQHSPVKAFTILGEGKE